VVDWGDPAADGAASHPSDNRHEKLEQTEMESQPELGSGGFTPFSSSNPKRNGKSVHCHPDRN
jgi:hypothetical protein